MIKENNKLDAINLKISDTKTLSKSDLLGKKVIIYFYPKDDTPGCTKEAVSFNNVYDDCLEKNILIFTIL